ncbi:MAG: hypothetical protein ACD_2C00193G0021 [uncultured bacterium (gcode 4)]|uniref:Divalent-cation tolerance protein CutA n=1 Tax=uncultured bacterium (gcode 4) TaxID=1234023 RepID=K2H0I1_9BACT|nr:MAG: hypothetical protein ACD_2C00193G0021 [uncultured bacterium (gcode 4)]
MFIMVYVTHENEEEAQKVVSHLLDKQLIKCANTFPISADLWWLWKIDKNEEMVTILKAKKENWLILKEEISKIHPYDVPCIIKIEVEANEAYEAWINE